VPVSCSCDRKNTQDFDSEIICKDLGKLYPLGVWGGGVKTGRTGNKKPDSLVLVPASIVRRGGK
jgi:hypothetical protein